MAYIRKQLRKQIKGEVSWKTLQSFIAEKGNSKLGDSLVNFIYSLAKSGVSNTPTGTKVSDLILSKAYRSSKWDKNKDLKLKGDKGRLADQVESLILFFWVYDLVTLDECIYSLMNHLDHTKLHHPREEEKSALNAFQALLNDLFMKLETILKA